MVSGMKINVLVTDGKVRDEKKYSIRTTNLPLLVMEDGVELQTILEPYIHQNLNLQ